MKRILYLAIILFLLTGCGKINESWNGIYENGGEYSILIYTKDNVDASVYVKQTGENFVFYPIMEDDTFNVQENVLSKKNGLDIKIEKNGTSIKITSSDDAAWNNANGEYQKVKNVNKKSF